MSLPAKQRLYDKWWNIGFDDYFAMCEKADGPTINLDILTPRCRAAYETGFHKAHDYANALALKNRPA